MVRPAVIVVDTNVVAYLFLNGEYSDLSERLLGVPLATQDRLPLRSFPETARTNAGCLHV